MVRGVDLSGASDATTAVQAAIDYVTDAGGGTVWLPQGNILLGSSLVARAACPYLEITGPGCLVAAETGFDLLTCENGADQIHVVGVRFMGAGVQNDVPATSNSGIHLVGATNVTVARCHFSYLLFHGVYLQDCQDVQVLDNRIVSVISGIRFGGVDRGVIGRNLLRNPLTAASQFTVGIGLDSVADGYPICTDIDVIHNRVLSYTNAQSILVHAGQRIGIVGNALTDTMIGISINPFIQGDVIENIRVVGNGMTGTTTGGGLDEGLGIAIQSGPLDGDGNPLPVIKYMTVVSNTIDGANATNPNPVFAGMKFHYIDGLTVCQNVVANCYGNGFFFHDYVTAFKLSDNIVRNMLDASDGTNIAIRIDGANNEGAVTENYLDTADFGVKFTIACPGVTAERNYTKDVATP